MVELNWSFNDMLWYINRIGRSLILLFLAKEFKYTLSCRCHWLYLVNNLCNLLYWLCKVLYILDKCLYVTDCNSALYCKNTAAKCHTCISEVAYKSHYRLHHSREKLWLPCWVIQNLIRAVEFIKCLLLLIEELYYVLPAKRLFNLTVYMTEILLLLYEKSLWFFNCKWNKLSGYRKDNKCYKCHKRWDAEHHYKHTYKCCRWCNYLCYTLVKSLTERINIIGNSWKDLAICPALKVFHRHSVYLLWYIAS